MDDLFKKVFERILLLSDEELRARLDGAVDHPLFKVFEVMSSWSLLTTVNVDALAKHDIESYLHSYDISYDDLVLSDELVAANDARFALAA